MKSERTPKDILHAEYMRKWRKSASPESIQKQKEAAARWKAANRNKEKEYKRKYYLDHQDKWDYTNTPEHKAKQAAHRQTPLGKAAKKRARAREKALLRPL